MSKKNLIIIALTVFLIPGFFFWLPPPASGLFRLIFTPIYVAVGIWGLIIIIKKHYLTGISIVLFLLFGWLAIPIVLGGGPLVLLTAALLPERIKCPHCLSFINKNSTRCPRCQGITVPAKENTASSEKTEKKVNNPEIVLKLK